MTNKKSKDNSNGNSKDKGNSNGFVGDVYAGHADEQIR